ncbi:glycosyltransferase family 39 protein [uncultured Eudoraea sp.]|uniref:glycosyltransferase family 39 protein n=1 Tax=uncultured Eudoraea sp. TaxID=1035614 RepID=UPI00262261EE|nr:glycosyltransferase family 39 protein [uncultured Eudoraea sp.]
MKPARLRLNISAEWQLILIFALAKLLIHFFTVSNFELHRDAYLYYAQSEHLAWGYVSVPPSIAVIGKLATSIFGNTVFGLRFFPALIGALNLIIIGLFIKELGGKKKAIVLASLAYILSPSFLHTNALFQPVAFNHFYWLLSGYLILRMISRNNPKIWLWIAVVFGFAFLNKYSIVFFYAAFAFSLILSKYRYLYKSRYFIMALVIGLTIISPNLFWQYENSWPVLQHMTELRETQLIHVRTSDFIIAQFLMNIQALLIWILALIILLFYRKEKQYRLFGYIYIFLILLLLAGSGKPYYTLGIYPILFVFGSYFIEKYVKKYTSYVYSFLVISMFFSLYVSLSVDGIPFITPDKVNNKGAFRWEDGVDHDIPQDMADMTGWKEIGEVVKEIYISLGEENEDNCDIYCYHYGQAGAVMFYGKEIGIPQPISPNGSFVFWAPDSISKDYVIYIHSDLGNDINPDTRLPQLFEKVTLIKTIDNKYFRENGTKIYLCKSPNDKAKIFYKNMMKELKDNYR